MALNTDINIKIVGSLTTTADGQSDLQRRFVELVTSLSSGTAAGQADVIYHDASRTLGASGTENLDLAGSLTDPAGNTITMAKLKGVLIRNKGAGALTVSRPASNGVPLFGAASDAITVTDEGVFCVFDPTGYTVTAGTGDLLTFTADGSGCTYQIILIGTSA